jgi:ribose 5-phosphate isomerase A
MTPEHEKRIAAEHAVTYVKDGMKIGLGTGSTASFFVQALGERVKAGLRVQGVPTSEATRKLAEACGVPLLTFDDVTRLDLCVDGADEADPQLNLTKGGGGALLREKVVAFASAKFLVICDAAKLVDKLYRFPLPVEVVPFAHRVVAREIEKLGGVPTLRAQAGAPVVTDNHNWILDCRFEPIERPAELARSLDALPGVAEHGLFTGLASALIVGRGGKVEVIEP